MEEKLVIPWFANPQINGLLPSFLMIIGTEIGDKTFITTMLFSRKFSNSIVFIGSLLPLLIMSAISIIFGVVLPNFVPILAIKILSTFVFLIYSAIMFREGYLSLKDQVNYEIYSDAAKENINNKSKIFLTIFVTTFLAEWGDRSQLSTIALTSQYNITEVLIGTSLGHLSCSLIAIFFGGVILSKLSTKKVNYLGAIIFLAFSCMNLVEIYKALF
jgi:putative Ca2+/H+ antiporter (TMEM165/GDT1 family)